MTVLPEKIFFSLAKKFSSEDEVKTCKKEENLLFLDFFLVP